MSVNLKDHGIYIHCHFKKMLFHSHLQLFDKCLLGTCSVMSRAQSCLQKTHNLVTKTPNNKQLQKITSILCNKCYTFIIIQHYYTVFFITL